MKDIGGEDRPDLIWNCDESGLPHEPKKCRVISLRSQKPLQVVIGSDRLPGGYAPPPHFFAK